jgi:hypothetical protein
MPYYILHDERNQDHVFVSLDTEHVRKIPAALAFNAPDLLEACELQEIADYLAGWQEPGYDAHLAIVLLEGRGDYDSGWLPAREAAANYADYAHRARRAAIAKAKGGTQ